MRIRLLSAVCLLALLGCAQEARESAPQDGAQH